MTYKESKNTFFQPFLGSFNLFKAGVYGGKWQRRIVFKFMFFICNYETKDRNLDLSFQGIYATNIGEFAISN